MSTNRKWHEVDLLTLYNQTTQDNWNEFLTLCVHKQDIVTLEKTYYGIQSGMDTLVKNKLNSEKMSTWYLRLAKSIEITVKTIYRQKFPNRLDDPLTANALKISNKLEYDSHLKLKRNRDAMYETWLRKVSF